MNKNQLKIQTKTAEFESALYLYYASVNQRYASLNQHIMICAQFYKSCVLFKSDRTNTCSVYMV